MNSAEKEAVLYCLLERGDETVTLRQLVERFEEVEEEFSGIPWTLTQIYTQIDMLVSEKPCGDCISREAAIVALDGRMQSLENVDMQIAMGFAKGIIHELPPVQPKMGKWVKTIGENGVTSAIRCSECGFEDNRYELFDYCPVCGVKMQEVEE